MPTEIARSRLVLCVPPHKITSFHMSVHVLYLLSHKSAKRSSKLGQRQSILGGRSKELQQMKPHIQWQLRTYTISTKDLHRTRRRETWQSPLTKEHLILYLFCNPSYLKPTTIFSPLSLDLFLFLN